MTAIGAFLFFGAVMASFAGTTLIWPGTLLHHVWVVNAPAYRQLTSFGKTVGVPFLALSAAMAAAGVDWFGRRLWGWRLAVIIIADGTLTHWKWQLALLHHNNVGSSHLSRPCGC
jgi:hypothetical protein